ncbi:hypothetical protein [Roseiflexus sp. RS-1]|uniref:hypothetical protein n=1 Tax=Roseiflexus sp. (strain RS-1) TaxID=357808 RepID=UPI0000D7FD07|nr:hypothetical protein [Roseiflexus sp. RS-1]ABQ91188.1 hypothetical protein RoseRS_2817 [Roseiflexus sp. RS-1]
MRLFARQRPMIAASLVALALVVVYGCTVVLFDVRREAITPPQFALDMGLIQVLGRRSTVPECSYATSCLLDPSGRDPAVYTVWLILRSSHSDTPPQVIRLTSVPVGDGT